MKIKYLKINGFGNLKNKEINFSNKINIIYGKNEAGKSTILKFISSMFYGLSKSKNGKEISDYEKYKPWDNGEFSGKIKYSLDSLESYEVFREFNKKTTKIFNENLEDISKKYNIDKIKGNEFFYEQTKINEELFSSTILLEQGEIKLDKTKQNLLLQKISNIISSGNDNTSYKKITEKLNKKLVEEVGTPRTNGRPINIINEKIEKIKNEEINSENYREKIFEIENEKKETENKINKKEIENELLKKIKTNKEKEKIEKEKIEINKKIIEEEKNKINELKNKINLIKIEKQNKNNKINIFKYLLLILINILIFIFLKNKIIYGITIIIDILIVIINLIINKTKKIKEKEKINNEKNKIKNEKEIIEENKNKKINELKNKEEEFKIENNKFNEKIKSEYNNKINFEENYYLLNYNLEQINNKINETETELNNLKIKIHTLNLDKNNINPKLENLVKQEEELELLYEQKEELNSLAKSINLASNVLEIAYEKMKKNIRPKFIENLNKIIKEISNGKYENINFNDEKGLTVEIENGNYLPAYYLSIGTIDQMYLALRLSGAEEISKENMPIILDESFTFFDDIRLENILRFLNEQFKEKQIIIFTCTKREKTILNNMNIEYNLIEI